MKRKPILFESVSDYFTYTLHCSVYLYIYIYIYIWGLGVGLTQLTVKNRFGYGMT
jgi:hypothetical protein